ncbi:chromophore lyase CpcT/CpeT [Scytonema sp. NUACC26]|uniref:chromophore lyase CpcT/CpeT n=1 Tax=Scytonema sp. NUACC26 TaxID=3140176 RepID=UPI0034DC4C5E
MNKLKIYSLTFLFSVLIVPQQSRAVASAPPFSTQVKEVAQWFAGFFDNAQQVANNPTVPLITMSNCSVKLTDGNPSANTQNIYLEQNSTAFERISFYSFSEGNSGVNLSVRSFLNSDTLRGLCNQLEEQRIINTSNIATISCNLELQWEPNRYIGTNAPNGCPTSTGGKVVSNVTFFENGVNSLDQIFNANGNLIVNTPIEFRRINPIPEPSSILGILALGLVGTVTAVSGKVKHKST